jgi:hypothetical protein
MGADTGFEMLGRRTDAEVPERPAATMGVQQAGKCTMAYERPARSSISTG